jgi:hypothetical protein
MASRSQKKPKKDKRNQDEVVVPSITAKNQSTPSQLVPLEHYARFIHGSEDSRDVDCVYLVKSESPFPTRTQLVDFCRSEQEDRNVIRLGRENGASGEWFVKDSYRGPPDEVNNALLTTVREEFSVTQKVSRSVILRYVIASKAIIVRMRRMEECRKDCIAALSSWSFDRYMDTVHRHCTKFFSKLTRGAAKYVTFHLAQSYALSIGFEVFTKSSLTALFPSIKPLIYYQGQEEEPVDTSLVVIMRLLESVWYKQASKASAVTTDKTLHLQAFYLKSDNGEHGSGSDSLRSIVAENYLELECNGTLLDMQEERIVISPAPLFSLRAAPNKQPSLEDPSESLNFPPTWPIDPPMEEAGDVSNSSSVWVSVSLFQGSLIFTYSDIAAFIDSSQSKRTKGIVEAIKERNKAASKVAAAAIVQEQIDLELYWTSLLISGDGVVQSVALKNRLSMRTRAPLLIQDKTSISANN